MCCVHVVQTISRISDRDQLLTIHCGIFYNSQSRSVHIFLITLLFAVTPGICDCYDVLLRDQTNKDVHSQNIAVVGAISLVPRRECSFIYQWISR